MGSIVFKNCYDLDLKETLDCGQCFRWYENTDGSFSGVVRSKSAIVRMSGTDLIIENADEADRAMWEDYFDLSLNYGAVKKTLSAVHPAMAQALCFAPGIRVLNQEPFEALISFVISQNNNIKRIKGIIQRLCENFGEEIAGGKYAFPTAERLSSLEPDDLMPIRAGFRHRYIINAARAVKSGQVDLEALRVMPYEQAQKSLMTVTGIGMKVADCVLLYGLHRLESFPKDVWMKRAMKTLFDDMDPTQFGEYAGVAQQYIFHYARMHPELFMK